MLVRLLADEASEASSQAAEAATSNSINWTVIWNNIVNWAMTTGVKIIVAIIIMIVSFKIINFVIKRISRRLEHKKADPTLSRVLMGTLRLALKILVCLGLVGYVGFETASISAVIASLGVGISLAVQGTLSNFAGGVIIVIMRPFVLGDFITSQNQSGTVEDIKLFYTQIVTPDNKVVFIPNGSLANNVIVNASIKDQRRLDIVMPVSYDTNLELARNVLMKVCKQCELVKISPEPFVEIGQYGESSINLYVRVWVNRTDYWTTNWYLMKEFKNALDEHHIQIPFNQLDVHIQND